MENRGEGRERGREVGELEKKEGRHKSSGR